MEMNTESKIFYACPLLEPEEPAQTEVERLKMQRDGLKKALSDLIDDVLLADGGGPVHHLRSSMKLYGLCVPRAQAALMALGD